MFDRLMMTIRSNLNELVSRAENPEKVLNQVIYDMQVQVVEAKKQVALVIADEKRLHRQSWDAQQQVDAWERKAMLAVNAGDDNLARAALRRKGEHAELVTLFNEQWNAQRASVDQLRFALNALGGKIQEANRQRRVLIARQRRAEAQRMINETLSSLNAASPLGVLERMEAKIVQAEAEAEAVADISGQLEPSLEAQFRALEAGNVDDELAALKQKMALQEAEKRRALSPAPPSN